MLHAQDYSSESADQTCQSPTADYSCSYGQQDVNNPSKICSYGKPCKATAIDGVTPASGTCVSQGVCKDTCSGSSCQTPTIPAQTSGISAVPPATPVNFSTEASPSGTLNQGPVIEQVPTSEAFNPLTPTPENAASIGGESFYETQTPAPETASNEPTPQVAGSNAPALANQVDAFGSVPPNVQAEQTILQGRVDSANAVLQSASAGVQYTPVPLSSPYGSDYELTPIPSTEENVSAAQAQLTQAQNNLDTFNTAGAVPSDVAQAAANAQQPQGWWSSLFGNLSSGASNIQTQMQTDAASLSSEASQLTSSYGSVAYQAAIGESQTYYGEAALFAGSVADTGKDLQNVSQLLGSNPDAQTNINCGITDCVTQQVESAAKLGLSAGLSVFGGEGVVAGELLLGRSLSAEEGLIANVSSNFAPKILTPSPAAPASASQPANQ